MPGSSPPRAPPQAHRPKPTPPQAHTPKSTPPQARPRPAPGPRRELRALGLASGRTARRRYAELQRAAGASERLLGLLHRAPALPLSGGLTLPRSSWRGAVELAHVTFAYPANPQVAVLRGASLSIRAGQHVAIIGPSGCGKSTIAALLCALYAPAAGRTTLDGHDVLALDAAHLRGELVACVPQEPP